MAINIILTRLYLALCKPILPMVLRDVFRFEVLGDTQNT